MSRADSAVRRTLRHLAEDETLMASAVGYENEGRRRQVVLLSNRRVVVAGLRSDPPVELVLAETSGTYDPDQGRLFLEVAGEVQMVVRDIEAPAARQIVSLIDEHRPLPETASAPRVKHVHLQRKKPDDPGI